MAQRRERPIRNINLPSKGQIRVYLRWTSIVLLLVFFGGLVFAGFGGVTEIQDNEVAVLVNYLTGEREVITQPGNKIFIPVVEEVFTLDKSANKFLMEGKTDQGTDHVRELTVRASDGSLFWFESLEIQYELLPQRSRNVIQNSGTKDAFKKFWLMSYARSILRDEFGKFNPEEISNPSNYAAARTEAQRRINEMLETQGISVVQITIPKPKFAAEYEKAIEDRKLANQEVQRLQAQAVQLEKEKVKRLTAIESEKGQAYAALKGELAAALTTAEAEKIKVERQADAFEIQRAGEAEAEMTAMIAQARGVTEKNRKEAEGLVAKVDALARQGRMVVIEALAKKLKSIEIDVVPYQRSEAPERIEIESAAAASAGNSKKARR